MQAFIQTLIDDEEEAWYDRQDRREFYMVIRKNADHMAACLHDLQNILPTEYRVDAILMNWDTNVNIYQLIKSIVDREQERTDKHNLIIDMASQSVFVEADSAKMERVVELFISNAVKYSPDGGEVRVSARVEPPSNKYPYDTLLLQVKDQGLGLNMEDCKPIGMVYGLRKRDKDYGWPQRFIKAHNGEIWPESEGEGKGTTFNIRIPVKQSSIEELNVSNGQVS